MACLNPMLMAVIDVKGVDRFKYEKPKGWQVNVETGKAYRFVSKNTRNIPLEKIDSYNNFDVIEVPCGNCVQCRLDYAQNWAIRCSHEASLYKHNYFLTLTYDDAFLTPGKFGNPTLVKDEFTAFMKKLRYKFKKVLKHDGIRFFGCGEYGDINLRPHFHIILFNCPIPDLTFDIPDGKGHLIRKKNSKGTYMYFSQLIADCWTDENGVSKGFITLDDANFNTESYVSRYILKKQKGQNSKVYSDVLGIEPPFIRMSNRPGIGYSMFLEHKEEYADDPTIIVARPQKPPLVSSIPRYYKKKLFEFHPESREKFEASAKDKAIAKRSLNLGNDTTINYQRNARESKIVSAQAAYQRKL